MTTLYAGYVFMPMIRRDDLVRRSHKVFRMLAIELQTPVEVRILDMDADEEIPDVTVSDIEKAIEVLCMYSCPGRLLYGIASRSGGGCIMPVYYSELAERGLSVLEISLPQGAFSVERPDVLPQTVRVMEALHEEFSAMRSGFDWGFLEMGVPDSEEEEAELIASGAIEPRPFQWLDLIAPQYLTSEVLKSYQEGARKDSTLRSTKGGSLVWQRDAGPP